MWDYRGEGNDPMNGRNTEKGSIVPGTPGVCYLCSECVRCSGKGVTLYANVVNGEEVQVVGCMPSNSGQVGRQIFLGPLIINGENARYRPPCAIEGEIELPDRSRRIFGLARIRPDQIRIALVLGVHFVTLGTLRQQRQQRRFRPANGRRERSVA